MSYLGDRLSELRSDRGLTQKELSGHIHITSSSISAFETGERMPTTSVLIALSNYFDVTTDYLLGLSRYNTPPSIVNELFVDDVSYSDVIQSLKSLATEERRSVSCVLNGLSIAAEVVEKVNVNRKV